MPGLTQLRESLRMYDETFYDDYQKQPQTEAGKVRAFVNKIRARKHHLSYRLAYLTLRRYVLSLARPPEALVEHIDAETNLLKPPHPWSPAALRRLLDKTDINTFISAVELHTQGGSAPQEEEAADDASLAASLATGLVKASRAAAAAVAPHFTAAADQAEWQTLLAAIGSYTNFATALRAQYNARWGDSLWYGSLGAFIDRCLNETQITADDHEVAALKKLEDLLLSAFGTWYRPAPGADVSDTTWRPHLLAALAAMLLHAATSTPDLASSSPPGDAQMALFAPAPVTQQESSPWPTSKTSSPTSPPSHSLRALLTRSRFSSSSPVSRSRRG